MLWQLWLHKYTKYSYLGALTVSKDNNVQGIFKEVLVISYFHFLKGYV